MDSILRRVESFPENAKIPDNLARQFYALIPTTRILAILNLLLKKERIDPSGALVAYALQLRNEFDVFAVAACLRTFNTSRMTRSSATAFPDIYVDIQGISKHIVLAVYEASLPYTDECICLFMRKKFNPQAPAYSHLQTENVTTLSSAIPLEKYKRDVKWDAMLLGEYTEELEEIDLGFVLKSGSYTRQTKLPLETYISVDLFGVYLSVKDSSPECFRDYVEGSAPVSYCLLTDIILEVLKKGILASLWTESLLLAIERGASLDDDQLSLLPEAVVLSTRKIMETPKGDRLYSGTGLYNLTRTPFVPGGDWDFSEQKKLYFSLKNSTSLKEALSSLTKCQQKVVWLDEEEELWNVPEESRIVFQYKGITYAFTDFANVQELLKDFPTGLSLRLEKEAQRKKKGKTYTEQFLELSSPEVSGSILTEKVKGEIFSALDRDLTSEDIPSLITLTEKFGYEIRNLPDELVISSFCWLLKLLREIDGEDYMNIVRTLTEKK